eukprot:TRINITY_DN4568_c0_g1_i1.p1 TRINITY_DN4568_c0_g1~~TRINITY_DN4568_c0_g1_i1.p1  ORF type:complete len:287 (+),score=80.59 TRINITY_DN4568_c0_g1_i1:30-863(+)
MPLLFKASSFVRGAIPLAKRSFLGSPVRSSAVIAMADLASEYPQLNELKEVMNDFLANVLVNKPDDVYSFSQSYFSTFHSASAPAKKAKPIPIAISGPSGVGKGTLITRLLKDYPNNFGFSVSHTTRKPREGEKDGVHYNFTTIESIKEEIDQGKFIEHANVHGNYYGTSKEAVEKVVNEGKVCVLDIDVQGCESVKRSGIPCRFLFVQPPTLDELERRLRGRGTESEDRIVTRLTNARKEMEYLRKDGFFDYVIVNDDLDQAYADLKKIVLPADAQ